MNIFNSISELVGNTPLLQLNRFSKANNLSATLFAKLEFFNPAGSVKDRVALKMLEDAESSGKIKSGYTIIEPTSGNTGIGLAAIGCARGYNVIITMPDSMSAERIKLMEAYGARVVLTKGADGMRGAIEKANELSQTLENAVVMGQFENPSNPLAHYCTTGPEIWRDSDGKIDILVACVGTGGTISGAAKYLKEKNPNIKIVAVEPEASPVLSGGAPSPHKIQGIGAGFIPENLDLELIDEVICVSDADAYQTGKEIAKCEGILVGISSGAALSAALMLAKRKENENKNIAVILADTGSRYLSTPDYY